MRLLTLKEKAAELNVSERTLRRWLKLGVGPRPIDLTKGKGKRPVWRYIPEKFEETGGLGNGTSC